MKQAWIFCSLAIRSAWPCSDTTAHFLSRWTKWCTTLRAVRRATRHALVVADMPYGSFHVSLEESVRNAVRLVKEGGAEAVKVEGGERRIELIARLVEAEIPVMGHVGLTPQSVNALGGFHVQGKTADAAAAGRAGRARGRSWQEHFRSCSNPCRASWPRASRKSCAFPRSASAPVPIATAKCSSSTISSAFHTGHRPKFVRQYANLSAEISRAVSAYCDDVRSGNFPSDAESYHSAAELREHHAAHPEALIWKYERLARPTRYEKEPSAMNVDDFRLLYDFNAWANHRTIEACSALTPRAIHARPRIQLLFRARHARPHLYGAEWIWLERWHGRTPTALPTQRRFPRFRIGAAPLH